MRRKKKPLPRFIPVHTCDGKLIPVYPQHLSEFLQNGSVKIVPSEDKLIGHYEFSHEASTEYKDALDKGLPIILVDPESREIFCSCCDRYLEPGSYVLEELK